MEVAIYSYLKKTVIFVRERGQKPQVVAALALSPSGAPGIMLSPEKVQRTSTQNLQHAQQMKAGRQARKRFWEQAAVVTATLPQPSETYPHVKVSEMV